MNIIVYKYIHITYAYERILVGVMLSQVQVMGDILSSFREDPEIFSGAPSP